MIKRKTQILNVSSQISLNGNYKSQVSVSIPDANFSNPNIQSVYFSIQHCEVPNSFYIINYTNNILVINSVYYTLQRGNYSTSTFITYLLTVLPSGFGLTYNNITNKFTFINTTNFTINSSVSTINNVMGLGSVDLTSSSNNLTLPNCVNFLPLNRLNFRTNLFKFKNFNQYDNSGDIILSLQNNAPQMGCINFQSQGKTNFLLEDKSITTFILSVTDDKGNLINFNGIDWYITFQIEIEYLEEIKNINFQTLVNQYQHI